MEIKFNSYDGLCELEAVKVLVEYLIENKPVGHNYPEDSSDPEAPAQQVTADVTQQELPLTEVSQDVPPPPPPPEVSQDTPPPPAAAPAGNLDAKGCPWDKRIHSSGQTQYKSGAHAGTWIKKKNLDDAEYERIKAEIMGGASAPAPQVDTPPPPPPPPPVGQAAPAPSGSDLTWENVVDRVLKAKGAGTVNQDQLERQAIGLGVAEGFAGLVLHPEQWTRFVLGLGI